MARVEVLLSSGEWMRLEKAEPESAEAFIVELGSPLANESWFACGDDAYVRGSAIAAFRLISKD